MNRILKQEQKLTRRRRGKRHLNSTCIGWRRKKQVPFGELEAVSWGCSRRKGLEMALEKQAGGEGGRAGLWELGQEVWALSQKGRGTSEEGKPRREMIRLQF